MSAEPLRFLVTTARGHQSLLVEELVELGLHPEAEPSGAVALTGNWDTAARVLVRSRIASRVFVSLRRFSARNKAMLYNQVRRINWPRVFSNRLTFAVEAAGTTDDTDYGFHYAPLRVKDAVCDEFRKRGEDRPDVDRNNPDVLLNAFFYAGRCELSLDLCGMPLHRRGYRKDGAEAPIRENRAAALLRLCEYDGSQPFVDPFCGSGTLPIEAALIATHTAPGLLREVEDFSLGKLFPEAADVLLAEYDAAAGERRPAPASIHGSDIEPNAVAVAKSNAALAGLEGTVTFSVADALEIASPDSWIVANPPYGERLEDPQAAADLLSAFTRQVKHHATGSRLGLVIPRGEMEKAVGLKPRRRLAVASGPLQLRYACYEIRSGRFVRRD